MTDRAEITPSGAASASRRRPLWLLLPLAGFLALVVLFYTQLGAGDPSRIPSALLNKPVPDFALPPVGGGEGTGFATADLSEGVHVVNIWASWCGPCRQEHPLLMQLAEDGRFRLAGINYKDVGENALRFLGALGNPFDIAGADRTGAIGIDWGVTGVPETFIVKDGIIVHKFSGPLNEAGLETDFMPALEEALKD